MTNKASKDDRVAFLVCPGCGGNGAMAAVRIEDCQVILKCAHCGDVTGTQAFMSRELTDTLVRGNFISKSRRELEN